jgi:uncharacterized damage-inducible protein DinB
LPLDTRTRVFVTYLDYSRNDVIEHVTSLSQSELRSSLLPSGWTPLELVKHLTWVERRWIDWGFLGLNFVDPWGDRRGDQWWVATTESTQAVLREFMEQGERSNAVIASTDLSALGKPGLRWEGDEPPSLERILFHLLQEYARHLGHLDIVVELLARGDD